MWDLPRGKKAPREVKGTFLIPQELGGEWMGGEVSPWAEGHPPTPDSSNPQVHLPWDSHPPVPPGLASPAQPPWGPPLHPPSLDQGSALGGS